MTDPEQSGVGSGVVRCIVCQILGHEYEYTDEYEQANGHVRADRVCLHCGDVERAWTGPKADQIRSLGYDVPTREEAHSEVLSDAE